MSWFLTRGTGRASIDRAAPILKIPIYQVDAFSGRLFSGNPAAVCPLESWLPDDLMQSIAAENNLAETAFFVPAEAGYQLRWFTPMVEVDLCGHATLASAFVVFTRLTPAASSVRFQTKSGELIVTRAGGLLSMNFPARSPTECEVHPRLIEALGGTPELVLGARDYLVVYLNNVLEKDHRAIKRRVKAKQGFREIHAARRTIQGYEALHMIRKGQARWVSGSDVRRQIQFIEKLFKLAA